MGRILATQIKVRGISKNKVLACSAAIVIVLLMVLLFGDDNNIKNSGTLSDKKVDGGFNYVNDVNSVNSINNIIEKVEQRRSASLVVASQSIIKSLVTSSLPIALGDKKDKDGKIEVPPIINKASLSNTAKNILGNDDGSIGNRPPRQNNVDSLHAKSLVYTNNSFTDKSVREQEVSASSGVVVNSSHIINQDKQDDSDYLFSIVKSAKSIYELKAGTIIPATMINGLNSDLPGEVIAFVRSNVYDSVARNYLLIPQGSRLVGMYDANVIYGQERVAVAWHRLIYPNGSSINLKAMPGSDLEGFSGFYDKVDNKYARLFGASFIMGVITGAMQYSQNNTNSVMNGSNGGAVVSPSIGQTMSGSLGQQLGQTGLAITQKNLNVKPTIIIRPNYPFSIMTTADMILKPWKDK